MPVNALADWTGGDGGLFRRGLAERKVIVKMDGGDLSLEWREEDGHVYMTGPFTYVFRGEFFL